MMISCKKAAELICRSKDTPLTLGERLRLWFHLLMCRMCRAFKHECDEFERVFAMRFGTGGAAGAGRADSAEIEEALDRLPDEVCDRLKQRLREAAKETP